MLDSYVRTEHGSGPPSQSTPVLRYVVVTLPFCTHALPLSPRQSQPNILHIPEHIPLPIFTSLRNYFIWGAYNLKSGLGIRVW